MENKKISIIIPTYNCCDRLLKPCIESILKYTDTRYVELIVSANGCNDNTREYLDSLDKEVFKYIWNDGAIGFSKAVNAGIEKALGEYIILLNNDVLLLDQPKNQWIEMLLKPFEDRAVGISGPALLRTVFWEDNRKNPDETTLDRQFISFWCAAIRMDVIREIGLLDEIFNPGYGEDIDFCFKAQDKGYKIKKIPDLPIIHLNGQTFKNSPQIKEYLKEQEKIRGKWDDVIKKRYATNAPVAYGSWTGWIINV